MDNLRYISLKDISSERYAAIWEFPRLVKPIEPMLFCVNTLNQIISTAGPSLLEKDIKLDKVSSTTKITRELAKTGKSLLFEPNTLNFYLVCPKENIIWKRKLIEAIAEVCKEQGLDIEAPKKKNDIYLNIGGKRKKISGQLPTIFGNWEISITSLAFDFDNQTADLIYKNETNTGDYIGGLHEAKPALNPDDFREWIAQKVANKLELTLKIDLLTTVEEQKLDSLDSILTSNDWIEKSKRPLETYLTDY